MKPMLQIRGKSLNETALSSGDGGLKNAHNSTATTTASAQQARIHATDCATVLAALQIVEVKSAVSERAFLRRVLRSKTL